MLIWRLHPLELFKVEQIMSVESMQRRKESVLLIRHLYQVQTPVLENHFSNCLLEGNSMSVRSAL